MSASRPVQGDGVETLVLAPESSDKFAAACQLSIFFRVAQSAQPRTKTVQHNCYIAHSLCSTIMCSLTRLQAGNPDGHDQIQLTLFNSNYKVPYGLRGFC